MAVLPCNYRLISSTDILIHTRPKVVICSKLDPKTGSFQTWHFLPKSQLDDFCRYETNITGFLVMPNTLIKSSPIWVRIIKDFYSSLRNKLIVKMVTPIKNNTSGIITRRKTVLYIKTGRSNTPRWCNEIIATPAKKRTFDIKDLSSQFTILYILSIINAPNYKTWHILIII